MKVTLGDKPPVCAEEALAALLCVLSGSYVRFFVFSLKGKLRAGARPSAGRRGLFCFLCYKLSWPRVRWALTPGSPVGRLWGGVRSRLGPPRRCPAFSPDQCLSFPSPMIGEVVIHQSCVFSLCISFVICQFTFSTYVENILLKWSFDSRYDVLFWSGVFWDRRLQGFNGQIFTLKAFVLCAMF